MLDLFEEDLRKLAGRDRLRALRERRGIDFTSNDYLGLAESEELRRAAGDAVARGVPGRFGRFTSSAWQSPRT